MQSSAVTEGSKPPRLKNLAHLLFAKEGFALLLAWVLLLVVFATTSPYFFNLNNFLNIGMSVAIMGVVATGVTIGLIGGVMDLSVASIGDLSAVVAGLLYLKLGLPPAVCLVGGLCTGLCCGLINGITVTKLRINPIIATLATSGIFSGLAFLLTGGLSAPLNNDAFRWLARAKWLGIPSSVVVMAVIMVIGYVILRYTKFGRNTYAVGGNPLASRLSGINVDRHRMLLFVVVAGAASLGGLIMLSRIGTLIPNANQGSVLTDIAAAILGGTALAGGGGTIQGMLIGVMILGTLNNGLVMNNVNVYWQQIASGVALVIAVAIDIVRSGGYR
jgi:ribose transport system permease protein